ncbi:hypothetical protein K4R79_11145 [Staphylococcus epidermidis]|uniref:Uncharacterized protein n=1 Tax=Staphylococcus epidermidis TaxID=1282 RepID=A0A161G0R2_STAEP|nr:MULTISPECIES: hypothetical protein [Staphylococcus]MEB2861166.1 hypothetical protein [Staphylococcus sp. GCP4]AMX28336.1 hypothetical protein [Staphylococcus epidermidis]ATQ50333.1 hypothetical protein CPZ17_07655 [Staphylococcus epidermidis]ATQ60042.1 hypothetical protein CPZ21_07865 [Staphylococcus epidermidis]EFV90049.1 hypothetical protein GSEF_0146 [Staphylococcus epidermidis FRI909]
MFENKDDIRLLYQAVSELAEIVGHHPYNTKSISLLCLDLGITLDEFEKVFMAFIRLSNNKSTDDMNIEEFKSILIENVGKYDEITDSQTLRFIEGYARNYIPELLPYAEKLYLDLRV